MKTCDYCGKDNEDISTHCAGCGTILEVPEEIPERPKLPRTLDAKNAIIIAIGFIIAVFALGVAEALGLDLGKIDTPLGFILGGITIVYLARKLIPNYIRDASPTGAAWIRGPWEGLGKGLVIGLIIGLCNEYVGMSASLHWHHLGHRNLDPWRQMAYTPGWQQVVWVMTLVALAPPVEEMLYRGVLYGGFRKSFGREWAAFLVTGLFVLVHFPNYSHFPPYAIFVTAAAVGTLWCRLRWAAIGPAIALHTGYNGMVALAAVYWSWR